MKLHLKYSELCSLTQVVRIVAERWPNATMQQCLLKAMMERLMIDLEVKLFSYKKEYRFTWHPERAMAFYCVFENIPVGFGPYESQLILRIMDDIRKAYTPLHIFSSFKNLIQ